MATVAKEKTPEQLGLEASKVFVRNHAAELAFLSKRLNRDVAAQVYEVARGLAGHTPQTRANIPQGLEDWLKDRYKEAGVIQLRPVKVGRGPTELPEVQVVGRVQRGAPDKMADEAKFSATMAAGGFLQGRPELDKNAVMKEAERFALSLLKSGVELQMVEAMTRDHLREVYGPKPTTK